MKLCISEIIPPNGSVSFTVFLLIVSSFHLADTFIQGNFSALITEKMSLKWVWVIIIVN